MKRLSIILLALTLAACAKTGSRRDPTPASSAAVDAAIRAEVSCAKRYVGETDDGISDAATVALTLALRCGSEYLTTTDAVGATLDNEAQRRILRQRRASREERIESFLPVVMQYRQSRARN